MPAPAALTAGLRRFTRVLGTDRSKMVELAARTAGHGLAVLGVAVLFGAAGLAGVAGLVGTVVGVLAALGGWLATGWLLRRARTRTTPLLGRELPQRLLLVLLATALLVSRRPDDLGWVWLGTGVALATLLAEATLVPLLAKTQPVAAQLPGVPSVPEPPFDPALAVAVGLALPVLGGLLAAAGVAGWLWPLLAVLAAVPAMLLARHTVRANLSARQAAAALAPALERHRPAFAVYYAAVVGARYQLGMWLPYLERLGVPFVVITRSAETVPVITQLTSAPVVVPQATGGAGGLDSLVVPSLKAAFYVQGSALNTAFQRYRKLTHVWLNHGDSDKAANFSARHASFDRLFVSGQQGVERYAAHGVRVPAERFAVVGRPQLEHIEVRDTPPPPDAPRTVLYAPTWRGGRPRTNYSSLPVAEPIVDALLAHGATVVFRPHPLSHLDPDDAAVIGRLLRRLAADRERTGRAHLWGAAAETERDIPACINATDALVTDVSSVASDYLASGKPVAMVAIRSAGKAFRREFPMARVSYVIEKDLSTLDAALDDLLGADPLRERRLAYRQHCVGDALGADAPAEFLRVAGAIVAGRKVGAQ